MAPTPSEGSAESQSLDEIRAGVLRRPGLARADLRRALTQGYDRWLAGCLPADVEGVALAAVGSLGRGELSPYSDLDLVLLHTGRDRAISTLADSIWYPIWDSRVGLDHSVRTADEALAVARDDLRATLGMLDLRHLAGQESITTSVRAAVVQQWRASAPKRVAQLRELGRSRWASTGEGAYLLEPNLKDSRGGLRDVRALYALALAQLVDLPMSVRSAAGDLLDVRGELHRVVGREDDVLRLQEHAAVAARLGLLDADGVPDRDEVLRRVNHASRTVAHAFDTAVRRALAPSPRTPLRQRLRGRPAGPVREGIARDVVAQDGEVTLARGANPATDPGLLVRTARAAAEHDLPFAQFTLERLATESAPLPEPWPAEVRDDFVSLLGTGQACVAVLESLDLAGLLSRLIPEWDTVRSRAQHNPVHLFTVDRHLTETAAHAAGHTREVERPDLLLVGALLHDIGKGRTGDHSIVGTPIARTIAARMGFDDREADVIAALTRHHLLLPDTAMRRDIDDAVTIRLVTDAVEGSADVLDLLHALAIADAAATGPAAWSDWKANLIAELTRRARSVLRGDELPATPPLDPERIELAEAGRLDVVIRDREIVVAAPDGVGVLYRTAGVLAVHMLDIRQASIRTHAGMAVNGFVVEPRFGRLPDAALLRADLARALDGQFGLAERLREKESAYPIHRSRPPTIAWFDGEATGATVLEIRTEDSIGLLTRITAALERSQVDVQTARVSVLGHSVVGAFYVTDRAGRTLSPDTRDAIELELRGI